MGKTTNALNLFWWEGVEEAGSMECTSATASVCSDSSRGIPEDLQRALKRSQEAAIDRPTGCLLRSGLRSDGRVENCSVCRFLFLRRMDPNQWIDARDLIRTDSRHREAHVDWQTTEQNISNGLPEKGILVTQGFIASDPSGTTTTLGREGSDYSAAVFAYCLKAKKVSIWIDVPGILNADPRYFPDAVLLDRLSYDEAIELAYHGATVIHPRTIQPLKEKNIVLEVKSFKQPDSAGTRIEDGLTSPPPLPCFIRKSKQAFIQLHRKDLTFMAEEHLSAIYRIFDAQKTRVHLSAHSAVILILHRWNRTYSAPSMNSVTF